MTFRRLRVYTRLSATELNFSSIGIIGSELPIQKSCKPGRTVQGGDFASARDNFGLLACPCPRVGERILESYPPLHSIDDPPSPLINKLLRKPYPAQTLAIMGLVRRWQQARAGAVIAECGTGKTLISLGAIQTHAEDRPFTALAMVPPQLVEKWCREAILTLPRVRVFIIDGLRTPTNSKSHHGVNEVKLRNGRIVREGLKTSLSELRLRKSYSSARKRWDSVCCFPCDIRGRKG